MKSFFNKLFGRTVTFGDSISNFVNVLNADNREKKCNSLFDGLITRVDFTARKMVITEQISSEHKELVVDFKDIVTLSRMNDGRLRMWIKVEED